jgi:hypothetical protein
MKTSKNPNKLYLTFTTHEDHISAYTDYLLELKQTNQNTRRKYRIAQLMQGVFVCPFTMEEINPDLIVGASELPRHGG